MKTKGIIISLILLLATVTSADVPNLVNYQGYLTDAVGDPVPDGAILIKFTIYDAAVGGSDLWNSGFQNITTENGVFSYILGSSVPLPNGIFLDTNRYLGITVDVDPEITPRSRFISSSYAFEAQHARSADQALDSDNLGGQGPSYYLDWANLTSVPSGFADGTDDEGLSVDSADAHYVNIDGDNMTGDLTSEDGGIIRTEMSALNGGFKTFGSDGLIRSQLYSFTYGELLFYNNNEELTIDIGAGLTNGGFISVEDPNGSEDIYLNAGSSGNSTVNFPDNAIDNTEILDEPGLSQGVLNSFGIIANSGVAMQDLATTTITTPADGYIFLIGKGFITHSGTSSGNYCSVQIDEESGGVEESPNYVYVGHNDYPTTSTRRLPYCVTRTYFKAAGTYTFRVEALKTLANGITAAYYPTITAIFIPSSYGTVSTVAPTPNDDPNAKFVSTTDGDGKTSEGYEIDLRTLELKAKAAALKAKEAQIELMKAQRKQTNSLNN